MSNIYWINLHFGLYKTKGLAVDAYIYDLGDKVRWSVRSEDWRVLVTRYAKTEDGAQQACEQWLRRKGYV